MSPKEERIYEERIRQIEFDGTEYNPEYFDERKPILTIDGKIIEELQAENRALKAEIKALKAGLVTINQIIEREKGLV